LRGHGFIWQAITDPLVRAEVDAAMEEACEGLVRRHGLDPAGVRAHASDLVRRFGNRALGDQVARVARDPVRKLGPRDRLIGAALMCLEQRVTPEHLAFAAAAAIRYDDPEDEAARRVQRVLGERGLDGVLTEICGLQAGSPLRRLIMAGTARLRAEGWKQ
jgi:mannitol-1-phosphate 5-dehydrogenase